MLSLGKIILSGFGFEKEAPFISYDVYIGRSWERRKKYILNEIFTISQAKSRYCIGRYDLRTFESFPCPHQTEITDRKENICLDCFRFNGFNPSFYNVSIGQLSIKQREYNLSRHNVYLAYFNDDVIKVGISHHLRTITRLCEQGAFAALILANMENAYRAREMEELVSKQLNIKETLKKEEKRMLAKKSFSYEAAEKALQDCSNMINEKLSLSLEFSTPLNLFDAYFGRPEIKPQIIDLSKEDLLNISGKGKGLIGDILIMENADQQFMLSLSKLISHEIIISDRAEIVTFKPVQTSLF